MSLFVNFKKRGVSLPPGCKDLFDLLDRADRHKAPDWEELPSGARLTRDDSTASLSEIGAAIRTVLSSEGQMAVVVMASLDNQISIDIQRTDAGGLSGSVQFSRTSQNEQKMKALFRRMDLRIPDTQSLPVDAATAVSAKLGYHIIPIPLTATELTDLATLIFGVVGGMEPASQVSVSVLQIKSPT